MFALRFGTVAVFRRIVERVFGDRARSSHRAPTEIFAALDALAQGRRDGLVSAQRVMPGAIYLVVVISGLSLVVNSVIVAAAHPWRFGRVVVGVAVVVALDLVLFISGPFRKSYVASKQTLQRVSRQLDGGWFTTRG